MRLASLIFLILYSQATVVQGGATKCVLYEKVSSTNQSLVPMTSYTEMSRSTCATQCLRSVTERGYFTHNSAQLTCTCGLTLLPSALPPGDHLYEPKCNEPGYSLHVLASARVCVKYVNNQVSFAAAEAACLKDGALVFMADTQEKIALIRQLEPTEHVWVGVTDRETEGEYRWVDGRPTTTEQMDSLYYYTEPNDFGGEDCTCVYQHRSSLYDVPCSRDYRFVCELAIY